MATWKMLDRTGTVRWPYYTFVNSRLLFAIPSLVWCAGIAVALGCLVAISQEMVPDWKRDEDACTIAGNDGRYQDAIPACRDVKGFGI